MLRRLIQFTLLMLLLLCLAACGSAKITLKDVPLPPEARNDPIEGGYEVRLDLNDSDIRRTVEERFGTGDMQILTLPDATTVDDVRAFYTAALEKDGWKLETDLSRSYDHYELMVWSRAAGTGQQALAVAYVPKERDDMPNPFLMTLLTR